MKEKDSLGQTAIDGRKKVTIFVTYTCCVFSEVEIVTVNIMQIMWWFQTLRVDN
jgi:hypothetical protein